MSNRIRNQRQIEFKTSAKSNSKPMSNRGRNRRQIKFETDVPRSTNFQFFFQPAPGRSLAGRQNCKKRTHKFEFEKFYVQRSVFGNAVNADSKWISQSAIFFKPLDSDAILFFKPPGGELNGVCLYLYRFISYFGHFSRGGSLIQKGCRQFRIQVQGEAVTFFRAVSRRPKSFSSPTQVL